MTDSPVGLLSEREVGYLEQRRQAKAQGISLAEYCRRHELNVKQYYQIAREMAGKGVASQRVRASRKRVSSPATFAPVHITPAAVNGVSSACRIRHPSGWVIECAALPPPSWLTALMGMQRT
jgi:hypothetical protein